MPTMISRLASTACSILASSISRGIGENAVARTADAAESGEIDVVQHARLGVVGDVIAKYVEQSVTRAAGVDDGRHAGADAENIRIDAEGAETFHQMQVNVDQTGCDDAIFDVDHGRAVRFEIRSDGVDLAVAHANVENAILAAGGIDQAAAFQKKIS